MGTELVLRGSVSDQNAMIAQFVATKITKFSVDLLASKNPGCVELCASILKQSKDTLISANFNVYTWGTGVVDPLVEALDGCPNLQSIEVYADMEYSTGERLCEICQGSRSTLKKIIISGYALPSKMLVPVLHFITECHKLTHLELYWDKYYQTTQHVDLLFNFLKYNTSIELLRLTELDEMHRWRDLFEINRTITECWVGRIGSVTSNKIERFGHLNRACRETKATEVERRSVPESCTQYFPIKAFLQQLIAEGEEWNALKLVVLGHGEVGKTTLLHNLKSLRNVQDQNLQTDRTIGVECSSMEIGKGTATVWDFGGQLEYAVTHQFLLSIEMVVYVLCYDLSAPATEQNEQVAYWLDFLQSTLPCTPSTSSKWRVVMVGTKSDKCTQLLPNPIPSWSAQWPNIPLHEQRFVVSSLQKEGLRELFASLENICNDIFDKHAIRIPKSYKHVLKSLQSYTTQQPIVPLPKLEIECSRYENNSRFREALKYLHAIGHIVWVARNGEDLICLQPQLIPNIAAEFIAPIEVRSKLVKTLKIEVLDTVQIASIIGIKDQNEELNNKLLLMEHFGVCFKLVSDKTSTPAYLFPSLGLKSDNIGFSFKSPKFHFCGIRIVAPPNLIFPAGFMCNLITEFFRAFNSTREELVEVHSNGVVITCRGIFTGQFIVKVERYSKSIVLLLLALNPDLSFAVRVVEALVQSRFPQYIGFTKEYLCPSCISEFAANSEEIGTMEQDVEDQLCNPHFHEVKRCGMPLPDSKSLVHECFTHKQSRHNFFLSYRVATEGNKAEFASKEGAGGFVELLYEQLAPKKLGIKPLFVFWDKKCLKMGQDWEHGFLHGITSSTVIILIISNKVIEGICAAAPVRQDNVLLEYECALLQNRQKGVPVIPLFVAEMTGDDQFEKFDFAKANSTLPDKLHLRSQDANKIISDLSMSLPSTDTTFLSSIKETMEKIFCLQGVFLPKRGQDQKAIDELLEKAITTVQDYL